MGVRDVCYVTTSDTDQKYRRKSIVVGISLFWGSQVLGAGVTKSLHGQNCCKFELGLIY